MVSEDPRGGSRYYGQQARAVWDTIELIAAERGLSASGLARAAGLDPTALNPSRRVTSDGKLRLPRMETLLHLLDAAGVSFQTFASLLDTGQAVPAAASALHSFSATPAIADAAVIRMIRFSRLNQPDLFDRAFLPAGRIAGDRWNEIDSPLRRAGPHDYAIRLDSDAYEPVFRHGSLLLLAPDAAIRTGDRVLVHAPGRSDRPARQRTSFPPPMLAAVMDWAPDLKTVIPLAGSESVALSPHDDQVIAHRIICTTL